MTKVAPRLTEPTDDKAGHLVYCVALRAIYRLEAAHFMAQLVARKGWWVSARLMETFWLAGRPVLFLYLLCLAAAGLLAPVDSVPAIAFLIAGCSAVIAFALLARPSALNQRTLEPGEAKASAGLFGSPAPDEANIEDPDANHETAYEGVADNRLFR
jgi:hypothetical protein